jgi:hypothetical protein
MSAAARGVYSSARSYQDVNNAAAVVASMHARSNIAWNTAGLTAAFGYNAWAASSRADAVMGSAAEVADFLNDSRFSQIGVAVGLSKAAMQYASELGLTDAQTQGVRDGIGSSINRTQAALNNRLESALSECDRKFK